MRPFKYSNATDSASAVNKLAGNTNARFLAGGTNLLDLMKEDVERPDELIDITRLPLTQIKPITTGTNQGGISLGGLGRNTDAANHPLVRQNYPLLTQAILAGASGQIRNMATNGGNLLQRTRCPYFYDVAMPCNKREPDAPSSRKGCGALEGINRMHAIFGWSDKCVAVYPSDMAVALAALDAVINVRNAAGQERTIPMTDFHRLPGDSPEKDTNLNHGDLITAIELPKTTFADHSCYLKVRDRSSYAFALVSVAAALELEPPRSSGSGSRIVQVRIAMGGVAHKPWRAFTAEKMLVGKEATDANFKLAADAEMANARPLAHNKFKVELGNRSLVRALQLALEGNNA